MPATMDTIESKLDAMLAEKAKGERSRQVPWATTGPVGQDSRPFSILRASGVAVGAIAKEKAKNEMDFCSRLRKHYEEKGAAFTPGSIIVPFSSRHMYYDLDGTNGESLVNEWRQNEKAWQPIDYDEANSVRIKQKALSTTAETAGGTLVPFPTLMEVIDLQRNLEVFANAGAMEATLPPQGRMKYPKLTGGSTAFWVGEGTQITSSQQLFGTLSLEAKKLGIFVPINNEVFRYTSSATESILRTDMARVGALFMDLAELQGTGGTQPKGLVNYLDTVIAPPTPTPGGADPVTHFRGKGYSATGSTFKFEDVASMEGVLPDAVQDGLSWIVRRDMYAALVNRRADVLGAGDGLGLPLFLLSRGDMTDGPWKLLYGAKVVRSQQVSNARTSEDGSTLTNCTFMILGYFPDWITARMGVMEFLLNPYGDANFAAFSNDQTLLRGLQFVDAGPRHGRSFVMYDGLIIQ